MEAEALGILFNVVDFIRDRHGIQKINLMGICMGGTFCVIYSALHPEKIKNLVTTVAPTSFETDRGFCMYGSGKWTKVGTRDTEDLCLETGHIGIYVSSKSQRQFTPRIVQWLKEREGAPESQSRIVQNTIAGSA